MREHGNGETGQTSQKVGYEGYKAKRLRHDQIKSLKDLSEAGIKERLSPPEELIRFDTLEVLSALRQLGKEHPVEGYEFTIGHAQAFNELLGGRLSNHVAMSSLRIPDKSVLKKVWFIKEQGEERVNHLATALDQVPVGIRRAYTSLINNSIRVLGERYTKYAGPAHEFPNVTDKVSVGLLRRDNFEVLRNGGPVRLVTPEYYDVIRAAFNRVSPK